MGYPMAESHIKLSPGNRPGIVWNSNEWALNGWFNSLWFKYMHKHAGVLYPWLVGSRGDASDWNKLSRWDVYKSILRHQCSLITEHDRYFSHPTSAGFNPVRFQKSDRMENQKPFITIGLKPSFLWIPSPRTPGLQTGGIDIRMIKRYANKAEGLEYE